MNNYLSKWDNVVEGSHSELGLPVVWNASFWPATISPFSLPLETFRQKELLRLSDKNSIVRDGVKSVRNLVRSSDWSTW